MQSVPVKFFTKNVVLRELWQVVTNRTLFNYDFKVKGKSKFLEGNYERIPVVARDPITRTHTIGKCRECRTIPSLIHQIHQSYNHHKNVSQKYCLAGDLTFQKLFGEEPLDTVNETVNDDDESDSGSSSEEEEGFEKDEIE